MNLTERRRLRPPLGTWFHARAAAADPCNLNRQVEQVEFDSECLLEPKQWGVAFRAYVNGEAYPSILCRLSEEILDECVDEDGARPIQDFRRLFKKHQERLHAKAKELLRQGGRVTADKEHPGNPRHLLVFRREDFK